jgi:hypothetical protein
MEGGGGGGGGLINAPPFWNFNHKIIANGHWNPFFPTLCVEFAIDVWQDILILSFHLPIFFSTISLDLKIQTCWQEQNITFIVPYNSNAATMR